jgi:23S rRNA pseudouridine1911/1915/1917 synthase
VVEPFDILYEDNHCLVVNKRAGFATTHFSGRDITIDQCVKAYLKEKYDKPGRVFLGIVHRLDKSVSGVLLVARTSKAAARLAKQFREHSVIKVYWAIVSPRSKASGVNHVLSSDEAFHWRDWLKLDDEAARVRVVSQETPGAVLALTRGKVLARSQNGYLLELCPSTGRKHQLRVQLASRGLPIIGDRKYRSDQKFPAGIALHARSLTFQHPIRHEPITITAEVPDAWSRSFLHLLPFSNREI